MPICFEVQSSILSSLQQPRPLKPKGLRKSRMVQTQIDSDTYHLDCSHSTTPVAVMQSKTSTRRFDSATFTSSHRELRDRVLFYSQDFDMMGTAHRQFVCGISRGHLDGLHERWRRKGVTGWTLFSCWSRYEFREWVVVCKTKASRIKGCLLSRDVLQTRLTGGNEVWQGLRHFQAQVRCLESLCNRAISPNSIKEHFSQCHSRSTFITCFSHIRLPKSHSPEVLMWVCNFGPISNSPRSSNRI